MVNSKNLILAMLVAGSLLLPTAMAREMFNDHSIRSAEPNAFGYEHSKSQGWWSNVYHDAADEDARLGPGMYALLHGNGPGQGDIMGDYSGKSTTADATPYLDFVHTNFYGAIIMSDPNDATAFAAEQRFSYPGFIAFTVIYGYYNECFGSGWSISGSAAEMSRSKGAESIDDPLWCGHPDFVAGNGIKPDSTGSRGTDPHLNPAGNDEFVYIYKGAGGPAKDIRDRNNLAGEEMIYSEIIEQGVSIPVCSTSPEACATRDAALAAYGGAAHRAYDLFDQDCGSTYECEGAYVVPLWDQRVTCGSADDAERAEKDGEHSTGNNCVLANNVDVPNHPLGSVVPASLGPLDGVVIPDANSPQQAGEEAARTRNGCIATQNKNTPGCQSFGDRYADSVNLVDGLVPDYLDTQARPAYRQPPRPVEREPLVTYSFSDSRRGASYDRYTGGIVASYAGSLLNGLHIVTWVGKANDIDANGFLLKVNEGPDGWKTASIRDVDYFNYVGEDASFVNRIGNDPSGFALDTACFVEEYLHENLGLCGL